MQMFSEAYLSILMDEVASIPLYIFHSHIVLSHQSSNVLGTQIWLSGNKISDIDIVMIQNVFSICI